MTPAERAAFLAKLDNVAEVLGNIKAIVASSQGFRTLDYPQPPAREAIERLWAEVYKTHSALAKASWR